MMDTLLMVVVSNISGRLSFRTFGSNVYILHQSPFEEEKVYLGLA